MPRQQQSDQRLHDASWHVHYEWTMVSDTAAALQEGLLPSNHRRWAVLESFGMHARALLFFFHPTQLRDNDILATDFFWGDEVGWSEALGAIPTALDHSVLGRLNREFAHLSYDRLLPDRPTRWPVLEMEAAINGMIRTFRARVRPELLHWMWTNNSPARLPHLASPSVLGTARSVAGSNIGSSSVVQMRNTPSINAVLRTQGPVISGPDTD